MARSSGPVQSGCRHAAALVDSRQAGCASRRPGRRSSGPSSIPPPPGLAPWPSTISMASALRRSVGVHPVAGRQVLVDEVLGLAALLGGHAAVPGGGGGADLARAAAEGLLGRRGQRAEAHAGDGDRDVEVQGVPGVAGAENDVGVAALAVPLQRVAGHAGAEEQQVVEVGQRAFGAPSADVVDAGLGGALDAGDGGAVEGRGLAQPVAAWVQGGVVTGHGGFLDGVRGVVDGEVVEPAGGAVAPELGRRVGACRPRPSSSASSARCSARISFSTQSAPSEATAPRT